MVAGTGKEFGSSDLQITLSQVNLNGNFQWVKYYDRPQGSSAFFPTTGFYMEKTSVGDYVLLGSVFTSNMHVYLIKVNIEGQLMWEKILTAGQHNIPQQIMLTKDNELIILSNAVSYSGIYKPRTIKIDYAGNIIWDKYYEDDAFSAQAFAICQTADGGYAISGEISKDFTGSNKAACLLLKLKSDGTSEWEKLYSYGHDIDYWWTGYDLIQTKDNGFLITGKKSWIWNPPQKDWGYWLLKTDPSGEFE